MLLSREYPTAITGREEQESALMMRLKVDPTAEPFEGLEMLVPAIAGSSAAIIMREARERLLIDFIEIPSPDKKLNLPWLRVFPGSLSQRAFATKTKATSSRSRDAALLHRSGALLSRSKQSLCFSWPEKTVRRNECTEFGTEPSTRSSQLKRQRANELQLLGWAV